MKLGVTRVKVRLLGPKGKTDLEMLVDTGATLSKIPEAVARRLGIAARRTTIVELSDGTQRTRGMSQVDLELDGSTMTVPVLIGPDGEEALLGLTTLETFGLKVNTVTRKLEPAKFIEYQTA